MQELDKAMRHLHVAVAAWNCSDSEWEVLFTRRTAAPAIFTVSPPPYCSEYTSFNVE